MEEKIDVDWGDMVGALGEVEALVVAKPAVETPVRAAEVLTPAAPIEEVTALRATEGVIPAQAPVVETPAEGSVAAVETPVVAEDAAVQAPAAAGEVPAPTAGAIEPPAQAETPETSEAGVAVAGTPAQGVSVEDAAGGELPAPAEKVEPARTFADGVVWARAIAGAAEDAVVPLRRDLGEREISAEGYAKNKWVPAGPELDEKTVENMKVTLERVRTGGFTQNSDLQAGLAEMQRQIDDQDDYQEYREYAEGLTAENLPVLRKALKELSPGVFRVEAALQTEMGGLREFFGELGDLEEQRRMIEAWDRKKQDRDFMDFADAKKIRTRDKEVDAMRPRIAGYQSLEGLLSMGNMPVELRSVIEAAREGRYFNFGEGPIAEFRQKIYSDILNSLGLQLPERKTEPVVPAAAEPAEKKLTEEAAARAKEAEAAAAERLREGFTGQFGTVSQELAGRAADRMDQMIETGMRAGRTAEATVERLESGIQSAKDKETVRRQMAYGVLALSGRTADSKMDADEKRKKLTYLSEVAKIFFGAASAGSSLVDFMIKSLMESVSAK